MTEQKVLSKEKLQQIDKAFGGLIKAREDEVKIELSQAVNASRNNFDIQRRGQNLPGDTGNNFGLMSELHGGPGGMFSETYPGSYFFSGMFGGQNSLPYGMGGGLGNGVQGSFTNFARTTRLAHYKMSMCVSAYKGFGIAKNVIDLMANFAAEGLRLKHPNKTVQKFYEKWAQATNLQGRIKDILRYYYKYGNVFIYTTNGVIDQVVYDRMRRTKADVSDPNETSRMDDAVEESKKKVSERQIPWRYTLLNPFQMELRGSKYFGGSRWVFMLDEMTTSMIQNSELKSKYTDFLEETDVNLPPEFQKLLNKKGAKTPDSEPNDPRVIELDQKKLYTLHYMKDDHEDWADPLLWPVMNDIVYKNKLRQMDMSVANSVINAVTIFKLGNLKEGFIAPPEHFTKFAEFLRTPTQAMNMVWNDAVDIVSNYPPIEKILNMSKYESVDRDILRGIGVPDTLLGGGGGGNFSNGFLGVRTLLERLEEGRASVLYWLEKQLELIAETMGHRQLPKVRFGKMSLRDEQAEKQLILALLDRNVISIEAVLETFGEDFEIELQRMREEQKIRDEDGLLHKHGPFVDPMSGLTDEEVMDKEADIQLELQKQKPLNVKPNGRPPGSRGIKQQKKRETKPQGMAWVVDFEKHKLAAFKKINLVEEVISKKLLEDLGKKTKRSLSKEESKGVEEITFAVASHIGECEINLTTIQNVLKANMRVETKANDFYYELKNSDMTYDERKQAMASAIAFSILEEQCQ